MEPEGSLPHSQVPANRPYPEPDRSSPSLQILLPEDPSYPVLYVKLKFIILLVDFEANQKGVCNCVYKKAHMCVCVRERVWVSSSSLLLLLLLFL